jgi:hypothetical protein
MVPLRDAVMRVLRPLKTPIEAYTGSIRQHLKHRQRLDAIPTLAEALQTLDERWELQSHRESLDPDAVENRPVFIFSAGWRSGSTLLQRLVMSSGEILIWGEPYDQACYIQDMAQSLRQFTAENPPDHFFLDHYLADVPESAAERGESLSGAWIANLYPHPRDLQDAHRAFLKRLYEAPADTAGFGRWGLKEVRFSVDHALYLRWLFPGARFLFLVRNPYRAYRSYRHLGPWYERWPDRPILTPTEFGRLWRRLAGGFIEQGESVGRVLRHEDLTEGRVAVDELSEYLDLPLNAEILGQRVTGRGPREMALVPGSESRLLRRAVQPLAAALGYQPD